MPKKEKIVPSLSTFLFKKWPVMGAFATFLTRHTKWNKKKISFLNFMPDQNLDPNRDLAAV